jgi:lipid-A-disaccharide synthase
MELAIVAGEVSGDIQAGRLVKEIKTIEPDLKIWGICGPKMQEAGAEKISDITELAVVGFFEVIKNYGRIRKVFYKILNEIKVRKPKAVILVDYPGFNLRLAKEIKKIGIPVFYYISPQVWAWGKGRVKQIREFVDKMIVIFPFEKEFYEKENISVEFVGHPIIDVIENYKSNKENFRKELNVSNKEKLIGILPGSRENEIKKHLPVFLDAAEKIQNVKFIIAAASENIYKVIKSILDCRNCSFPVLSGRAYEIMEASDLIFTSSGTATIETACFGTPMIVVYKLNWLSYFFIKSVANIKYIAMTNVIAGKKIVPEFIQNDVNPENIADQALNILKNPENMKKQLNEIKQKLGERGAAKRAANIICEAITG